MRRKQQTKDERISCGRAREYFFSGLNFCEKLVEFNIFKCFFFIKLIKSIKLKKIDFLKLGNLFSSSSGKSAGKNFFDCYNI